jgi:hypothetical protein
LRPAALGCLATAALALVAAQSAHACSLPVLESVAIDGSTADWTQVLVNPLNAARDGDGHSVPCALSTDRDCPISGSEDDLARFAWTADGTFWSFLLERHGNDGPWGYFYIYLDTDFDARMETGEPVLYVRMNSIGTSADFELRTYTQAAPGGDPLQDAQAHADGMGMPGAVSNTGPALPFAGPVAGGLAFEGAVSWMTLGLPPSSPLTFHVSTGTAADPPGGLRDNMGGGAGAQGTAGYRGVSVAPSRVLSAGPGQTLRMAHRTCNAGNIPVRLDLVARSTRGWDITFYRDTNGDGVGDVYLGLDDGGDADWSRGPDDLVAAGDTDGDGVPDTGLLGEGECYDLVLEQSYPTNANGVLETIAIQVERQDDAACVAEASDTIHVGRITLFADEQRQAVAGNTVWFPHVVQNNTAVSERIDFSATSTAGWPYTFWYDPNGDGDPADAVALFDTDGTGLPDVGATAGESVTILARTVVPLAASVGSADDATIRAYVAGNVRDTVTDRATVAPPVDVFPEYLLAAGDELYGAAGGSVYFAHRVRNALGTATAMNLSAVSDLGWATTLLSDPNGDGRPYDGDLLPGATGVIAGNGGEFAFIIRVDVPSGSATGTQSRITVTATAQSDPAATDAAGDDAFAAIVRVYEDAGHVVNLNVTEPCSTVYAQASGLPASDPDYRFVWYDEAGTSVRVTMVATDVNGECEDQLVLPLGGLGVGWAVEIQHFDGFAYVVQDRAEYDVEDAAQLASLVPGAASYHVTGTNLTATAVVLNTSMVQVLTDVALRWVVLTPDRAEYLRSNGTFATYSGTQATQSDQVARLNPGDRKTRTLGVAGVSYPTLGTYVVEIYLSSLCGGEFLAGSVTFEVVDDEDGDGLSTSVETAAGTDAMDADSDDDGLSDGTDGLTDSDGDGAIDALDCDSDDDGVLDGTEAGVWAAGDDTNPAAGCFRADLWPGDTTNPDAADTDGGGVPDGVEDQDRDGKIDPGELDPRDPADDLGADSDMDGLTDVAEGGIGTDPLDRDTDDDGVPDGLETSGDADGDTVLDALECDADGDGLPDGLERGVTAPDAGTDTGAGCYLDDRDPATTTDPERADTDGAGVLDGAEDADRDGRVDAGETDPGLAADDDTDGDALPNLVEDARGTSRTDRDSDDDGVTDGLEAAGDADGDTVPDALECDADGDGLPDGLERGALAPDADTDLAAACFVADADPASVTDASRADSDGGGALDGEEDLDRNGRRDAGETDPAVTADDDNDRDGLPNASEDVVGTSRTDRDTDDDGVLDSDEWLTDADGDTLSDARECDADGDGLSDGLERGVTVPDAGTDPATGCFSADDDPATTTDPTSPDSDGGGESDGAEDLDRDGRRDAGETDPSVAADDDTDRDGLPNLAEDARGTSRTDRDTDDDGLLDAGEAAGDADGDTVGDALECDADGDGLPDGLERGVTAPDAGTDVAAGCFRADADPGTTTDPASADTDGAGEPDGAEDVDRDGRRDPGETDPTVASDDDTDRDALSNLLEDMLGTSRTDRDTDDDGLPDGAEGVADSDGDGVPDARECDADADGLPDGLEAGRAAPDAGTDLAALCFVADGDPATTTDSRRADSDGGGVPDGAEDEDKDGVADMLERDPARAADDPCTPGVPAEVGGLRVSKAGSDAVVSWQALADPCSTYALWVGDALPAVARMAWSLPAAPVTDSSPIGPRGVRFYLVSADSPWFGNGPHGL